MRKFKHIQPSQLLLNGVLLGLAGLIIFLKPDFGLLVGLVALVGFTGINVLFHKRVAALNREAVIEYSIVVAILLVLLAGLVLH